MEISAGQIIRNAKLARIHIEEEEVPVLGQELSGILHWIAQLEKVNIEGIPIFTESQCQSLPEREDEVADGNCVEEILANAPEKAHDMFSVPRVVE